MDLIYVTTYLHEHLDRNLFTHNSPTCAYGFVRITPRPFLTGVELAEN